MKNLMIAALAALSLNATANAGTPAAQSDAKAIQPVIQLRSNGGMPVPGQLASQVLTVTADGEVYVQQRYNPKDMSGPFEEKNFQLGTLSAYEMIEIQTAVASLRGGTLVGPKQPMCMDAPGFQYNIFKHGKLITVVENYGCIERNLRDHNQLFYAQRIKEKLDMLNEMAH